MRERPPCPTQTGRRRRQPASTAPPKRLEGGVPSVEAVDAIRILAVDDHQIVLDGLSAMLRPFADEAVIVAATTDPAEARRLAADLRPDVVLVDVRMRSMSGLELCEHLRRDDPEL